VRPILTVHAPNEARQQVAERIVKHVVQSNFEINEATKALRQRLPDKPARVRSHAPTLEGP
jgi:hypothetical protein